MGTEGPSWPAALSRATAGVGAEAWEARLLVQPSPHSPPDPVPTLALTGPDPSARSQPTRPWWPDSGPCSCVLLNSRGMCSGPGWAGTGHGAGPPKVSGAAQRLAYSILASLPSPTKSHWTQHPFVPHHVPSLGSPASRLCESVSLPALSSLSTAVSSSTALPFLLGCRLAHNGDAGSPRNQWKPKDIYSRTALDRQIPREELQAARPSRRGWEAPEPPARANRGHSSF